MDFDHQYIRQLLDDYFEGETTLEDENQLRFFFRQQLIPEDLQPYALWFRAVEENRSVAMSNNFHHNLLTQIKAFESAKPSHLRPRKRSILSKIAAILIGLGFVTWLWTTKAFQPVPDRIDWSQYEPKTPEEAMAIYQQAILKVSVQINHGASKASGKLEKMEELGAYFK